MGRSEAPDRGPDPDRHPRGLVQDHPPVCRTLATESGQGPGLFPGAQRAVRRRLRCHDFFYWAIRQRNLPGDMNHGLMAVNIYARDIESLAKKAEEKIRSIKRGRGQRRGG